MKICIMESLLLDIEMQYNIAFYVYPCLYQIELDKTAEDFRKAHQERQELIGQWENTIEQMQRRDREMDLLAAVSLMLSWKEQTS